MINNYKEAKKIVETQIGIKFLQCAEYMDGWIFSTVEIPLSGVYFVDKNGTVKFLKNSDFLNNEKSIKKIYNLV